jgi:hypothetical protein
MHGSSRYSDRAIISLRQYVVSLLPGWRWPMWKDRDLRSCRCSSQGTGLPNVAQKGNEMERAAAPYRPERAPLQGLLDLRPSLGHDVAALSFTAIDFPGATATVAAGINAAGDIVGGWSDATGTHGFLLQAGVFSPISFPLATSTTAFGINDTGEIAGFYSDAAGTGHGFIYAGGAFSTVDVAGARSTQLTRIKNGGAVTGVCYDALSEGHGLTGQ